MQISAENGVFGQTGPKVGSFDAGYGSSHMARLVGTPFFLNDRARYLLVAISDLMFSWSGRYRSANNRFLAALQVAKGERKILQKLTCRISVQYMGVWQHGASLQIFSKTTAESILPCHQNHFLGSNCVVQVKRKPERSGSFQNSIQHRKHYRWGS